MTEKAFKRAILQVSYAQSRLNGMEDGMKEIKPGESESLLDRFKRDSAARGGEQYLVDRTKILCRSAGSANQGPC